MKTKIKVNVDEQGADYITELTTTELTIAGRDSVETGKLEECSKEILISIIKHLVAMDTSEVIEEYKQRMITQQKEYLRQLNWYKRFTVDKIDESKRIIEMLDFIRININAAEQIQENLDFKRRV